MNTRLLSAVVLAVLLPFSAQAATISASNSGVLNVAANGSVSETFSAGGSTWSVDTISLVILPSALSASFAGLTASDSASSSNGWTSYSVLSVFKLGYLSLAGLMTSTAFTLSLNSTTGTAFQVAYSFSATEIPAVPAPAAGSLLLGALAGLAAIVRRRARG